MLNNLTNFYSIIRGRMLRNSTTVEGTDIIPLGVVNPNYGGGYAPSAITVQDFVDSLPTPTTPTLQDVSDAGGLNNDSTISKGIVERFGLTGISRVCSQGYEIQFVNGVEYYLTGTGGYIYQAVSCYGQAPDPSYDDAQGFQRNSIYNNLRTNISYICTDPSTANAVWLPMAGEYRPTLDGASGALSNPSLTLAVYSINNGIVDVTILGSVDVDFSISSSGAFNFTLPIPSVSSSNIIGNVSVVTDNDIKGVVKNEIALFSRDSTLIINTLSFVAKFTYQAY